MSTNFVEIDSKSQNVLGRVLLLHSYYQPAQYLSTDESTVDNTLHSRRLALLLHCVLLCMPDPPTVVKRNRRTSDLLPKEPEATPSVRIGVPSMCLIF